MKLSLFILMIAFSGMKSAYATDYLQQCLPAVKKAEMDCFGKTQGMLDSIGSGLSALASRVTSDQIGTSRTAQDTAANASAAESIASGACMTSATVCGKMCTASAQYHQKLANAAMDSSQRSREMNYSRQAQKMVKTRCMRVAQVAKTHGVSAADKAGVSLQNNSVKGGVSNTPTARGLSLGDTASKVVNSTAGMGGDSTMAALQATQGISGALGVDGKKSNSKGQEGEGMSPLAAGAIGAAAGMAGGQLLSGSSKENSSSSGEVSSLCNLDRMTTSGPDNNCMDGMVTKCTKNMGERYCSQFSQYYCGVSGGTGAGTGSEFCSSLASLKRCTNGANAKDPDCDSTITDDKLVGVCPDFPDSIRCAKFYAANPSLHPDMVVDASVNDKYGVTSNQEIISKYKNDEYIGGGSVSTQSLRQPATKTKRAFDVRPSKSLNNFSAMSSVFKDLCDEGEVGHCKE